MSASEWISTDPCTGEVIWRGPQTGPAELDDIAARARAAYLDWRETPKKRRIGVARDFAARVKARREEIARLISRETGKPYWETLTEADAVAGKIDISIRAMDERTPDRVSETAGVRAALAHRPHGVAAVLGPFNFPMHLPGGHIAPALLAGNAVIFKPSEKTPASGLMLTQLWREAGAPDDLIQTVVGGPALGQALVTHAGVDAVLFTGGVGTGKAIHRALADTPQKLLALELGGNNPLIVWDVKNAEAAAHLIVQSAYVSSGQRCSCARRLYVPTGGEGDRVIDALAGLIDRIVVGAPFDEPAPFMGPVIDNDAAAGLTAAAERLQGEGGKVIRPLGRPEPDKPFLRPGLIDMTGLALRDEEHFGPLLQVQRVGDFGAALSAANDTTFGLAAGLISDDADRYGEFSRAVRAGIVNWNRPTTGASSAAPFGGVGLSGNHRPSAYYAADYCAYPVASLEQDDVAFKIGVGLTP